MSDAFENEVRKNERQREYRQALELLEYIKERYILVEKSPTDNPSELLYGKLINNQHEDKTQKGGQTNENNC